jgi:hypothetical protein
MKLTKEKNDWSMRLSIETGDDGGRLFALQRQNGKYEMTGNGELVLFVSEIEAQRSGVVDEDRGKGKFRIRPCLIVTP